jgi:microcystin-dependent protein
MADVYIGQIIQFGGNFAIRNYALCNGQLMSIAQNTALFSILGTTYGGDGVQTFALPNLQGRDPIHQGTGAGLSTYVLGEVGGLENHTVLTTQLPAHTHTMTGALNASGLTPKATTLAPAAGSVLGHADDISTNAKKAQPAIYCPAGTATPIALGGLNVSASVTGNSIPLGILTPYLAITYEIALFGIFPSRN